MVDHPAHIQELLWLASYYERQGNLAYAKLIRDSVEQTTDAPDVWAAVRFIENALKSEEFGKQQEVVEKTA